MSTSAIRAVDDSPSCECVNLLPDQHGWRIPVFSSCKNQGCQGRLRRNQLPPEHSSLCTGCAARRPAVLTPSPLVYLPYKRNGSFFSPSVYIYASILGDQPHFFYLWKKNRFRCLPTSPTSPVSSHLFCRSTFPHSLQSPIRSICHKLCH